MDYQNWVVDGGESTPPNRLMKQVIDIGSDENVGSCIFIYHPDPQRRAELAKQVANSLNMYEG